MVVVEVSQHDEADIAGRHAGIGERRLCIRPESLEGPPRARDSRTAVDENDVPAVVQDEDVDRRPVPLGYVGPTHEPGWRPDPTSTSCELPVLRPG